MSRTSDVLDLSGVDKLPPGSTIQYAADAKIEAAVNPAHYKDLGLYSAVHVVEKWGLNYHLGQTLKYIQRAGKKPETPELQDLKKAKWYLERHIHLLDPSEPDPTK